MRVKIIIAIFFLLSFIGCKKEEIQNPSPAEKGDGKLLVYNGGQWAS